MAYIDYGAIVFKNGKLISTEMFEDMKTAVGWEDTKNDKYHSYNDGEKEDNYMVPLNLKGNYFAYIGDVDCTIAFYKCQIIIVEKFKSGNYDCEHEWFNCTNYIWSKWKYYVKGSYAVVTKKNGYLVCRWKYKGDKYKVYFGHGVDLDYYQKWHIVNYYRSLPYRLYQIKAWWEDKKFERSLRR